MSLRDLVLWSVPGEYADHESLSNLAPGHVYFGRGQTILLETERIKRRTIQYRRLMHRQNAA